MTDSDLQREQQLRMAREKEERRRAIEAQIAVLKGEVTQIKREEQEYKAMKDKLNQLSVAAKKAGGQLNSAMRKL